MAYKSLYRAYRPQVFEDVSGQEAIVTTLRNAVKENKIAHAYLFCGPRGTGKTTVAKIFAKAVNCKNDPKPCGYCENCKAIENGTYPDVIEIDAASNNGVEQVRDLIDKVKYAPARGKYKVYIIDEVHMMSTGAFNALLKTLEEPPAHVIFILATTEPQKILPTVISRCQRFDFTSLTIDEMVQRMRYIMDQEHKTYEEGALEQIATLANGGMRDALSILEQCLAFNDQHLSINDVNTIYGIVSMEDKIEFINTLLAENMEKALSIIDKFDHNGIDIKRLTNDLIDILKDVVIYKNTRNEKILSILNKEQVNRIAPYITSDEALEFIDILITTSEKYVRSVNPHIYFELAILKICNHDHTQDKLITKPLLEKNVSKDAEMKKSDKPSTPSEESVSDIVETKENVQTDNKEATQIDEDIVVDTNDIMNILVQADRKILNGIQEKWNIISQYMTHFNVAKYANMLSVGKPVAASKEAIVIAFEFRPDVNQVNYYKNYQPLEDLIKEVFGKEYRFVGIQSDEWKELRNHYIQLMRKHQLPKPGPIVLKHIDSHKMNEEKNLTEAQEFAIDTFGKDIVEFDDK